MTGKMCGQAESSPRPAGPSGPSIRTPTIWSIAIPLNEANAAAMNERNDGRPVRRCGAIGHGDDSVRWRVWAPKAERENRDGANDNNSWNCGAEGPTDDPAIVELRERQKCNLMSTLMLSIGVPMILGGDELSHSQNGNNNAYCQDNELTWLNWELDARQKSFLEFTKKLLFIWRSQPVLQRVKLRLTRMCSNCT